MPTNFHTGSQESGLSGYSGIQELLEASWMAWRITDIVFLFPLHCLLLYDVVHSDDIMKCNEMKCNN